jgi:hypothetical protein
MKRFLVLSTAVVLMPWTVALADLPYTFKAGDPIRAAELNANFQYLQSLGGGGEFETLIRRRATLSVTAFRDVVTVPDTAVEGWVLRHYATNCGSVLVRIDSDPEIPLDSDVALVVRPGETLAARCTGSVTAGASPIGYFMFNEQ